MHNNQIAHLIAQQLKDLNHLLEKAGDQGLFVDISVHRGTGLGADEYSLPPVRLSARVYENISLFEHNH
jgi:hypothetical protein